MHRVRVRATGREGFCYISPSEYAPHCAEPFLDGDPPALPSHEESARSVSAAPASDLQEVFTVNGRGPQELRASFSGDLDGDGTLDALFECVTDRLGGLAVLRHTSAGWRAQLLEGFHTDQPSSWYTALRSGDASYLVSFALDQSESGYTEEVFAVYRWDRASDGFLSVGRIRTDRRNAESAAHPSAIQFRVTTSGSLAVTGLRGPAGLFRYDAQRRRLVQ